MIIQYPSKGFVRAGKAKASKHESFSVGFVGEKYFRRFCRLKVFLFEEGDSGGWFIVAFFMMMPFMVVHFYALAAGASSYFDGEFVNYKF